MYTIRNIFMEISLLLIFFLVSASIDAQDEVHYRLSWKTDGVLWSTSIGLLSSSILADRNSEPITEAQINSLNSNGIWSFDRRTINNYSESAAVSSDLFRNAAYLAPLSLLFSSNVRSENKEIMLMYAEVIALNAGLTSIVKESAGRLRPYAYNKSVPIELKLSKTTRRSFFSGHVSHVASLSFFTAFVFSEFHPDSKYKYLVWAGAISAPAVTGYLRCKAGRHFPTDVMIGYGVGALVGYFIPKLHKTNLLNNIAITSANNGLGLTYQF